MSLINCIEDCDRKRVASLTHLLLRRLFSNRLAECFDERGVEGGAGLLLDLFEGFFDVERRGTGFICGEIVECLGKGHNASQEGNPFFFETKGVTGAVPSLVVEGNDLDSLCR